MHSIHFSASLGFFVAPLLATPFLKEGPQSITKGIEQPPPLVSMTNSTQNEATGYGAKTFFPMIALFPAIISLGFLFFHEVERKKEESITTNAKEETAARSHIPLIITMAMFFCLQVGSEMSLLAYLPTFAVESRLNLSRVEGATVSATLYGCFMAKRLAAMFASMTFHPIVVMHLSLAVSILGGVALVLFAETSMLALQVGVGILGVGIATMYATGLLWLEQHVVVTSKMLAVVTGAKFMPTLVGQFVVAWPMFLMYLVLGSSASCLLLFLVASCLLVKKKS
jgi:hypothetical protein